MIFPSNKKDTTMTFDEMRKQIGEWLQSNEGGRLWDLLTCLRGPDSPSELVNVHSPENSANYKLRRERKYDTVEVIRQKAFFGVVGGSARHHDQDYVVVNPPDEQDHFDRHVLKAACALGLEVRVKEKEKKLSNKTECEVTINLPKEKKQVKFDESSSKVLLYSDAWQQMVNAGKKLMVGGGTWLSNQYHQAILKKFPHIKSVLPDYSLCLVGGGKEWWVVLRSNLNGGWAAGVSAEAINGYALTNTLPGVYQIGKVVQEGETFTYITSTPNLLQAFDSETVEVPVVLPTPMGIIDSLTPPSTPNSFGFNEKVKSAVQTLSQKGYPVAEKELAKTKSSILKDLWEEGKGDLKLSTYVASGPQKLDSIFTNDGPLMAYLDSKKTVIEAKADMNTQGYDVIIHEVKTHENK